MEDLSNIATLLGPVVNKLPIARTPPKSNVTKGTTELLTFWEKRHKQYIAKQKRLDNEEGNAISPSKAFAKAYRVEETSDTEVIAEHIVLCAKKRQKRKKTKLLRLRSSNACARKISCELLEVLSSKGKKPCFSEMRLQGASPEKNVVKIAHSTDVTHPVPKTRSSVRSSLVTHQTLATPVKKEICQLYRNAINHSDFAVSYDVQSEDQQKKDASKEMQRRTRVIFLSEKQSELCLHGNVPKVPPPTPEKDGLPHTKFVPSLHDIKSQQALRIILRKIESHRVACHSDTKSKDTLSAAEAALAKIQSVKQQQRSEIYALNKVMAKLEEENFKSMKEAKV